MLVSVSVNVHRQPLAVASIARLLLAALLLFSAAPLLPAQAAEISHPALPALSDSYKVDIEAISACVTRHIEGTHACMWHTSQ